jgi:hypothetical protein
MEIQIAFLQISLSNTGKQLHATNLSTLSSLFDEEIKATLREMAKTG